MIITQLTADHVNEITEIENRSFITPWSRQTLIAHLENHRFFCNAAVNEDGKVMGYCISTLIHDEIHIYKIAVATDERRKGVAAAMLSDTLDFYVWMGACSVILEVRTTNEAAIALYRKLGFEVIRTRRNYYGRTGGDAFVMGVEIRQYRGRDGGKSRDNRASEHGKRRQKSLSTTYSARRKRDSL